MPTATRKGYFAFLKVTDWRDKHSIFYSFEGFLGYLLVFVSCCLFLWKTLKLIIYLSVFLYETLFSYGKLVLDLMENQCRFGSSFGALCYP